MTLPEKGRGRDEVVADVIGWLDTHLPRTLSER